MIVVLKRLTLFLAGSLLLGCSTILAPLTTDNDYPPGWGGLSSLGVECKALEGIYSNEGQLVGSDFTLRPSTLAAVLNFRSEAKTIYLGLKTRKVGKDGLVYTTLVAIPDGSRSEQRELSGCYCIKQTLACKVTEGFEEKHLGLRGSKNNLYLTLAKDRALIAKMQNYHSGVILSVPSGSKEQPWARFPRREK